MKTDRFLSLAAPLFGFIAMTMIAGSEHLRAERANARLSALMVDDIKWIEEGYSRERALENAIQSLLKELPVPTNQNFNFNPPEHRE